MSSASPDTRQPRRSLPRRQLGRSGPEVSVLGFGAASYWGHPRFEERQALELVGRALELEIDLFDTGPIYSRGNAEPRLGLALREHPGVEATVCTKAGTELDRRGRVFKDFRPAALCESVERSLGRLGRERIDVLFLHGPDLEHLTDELRSALLDLKQSGSVGLLGLNSFDEPVIGRCLDFPELDCLMIDYNLLRLGREPHIRRWAEQGRGVLAAAPLARAVFGNRLLRLRGFRDLWYLARILATRRDDLRRARAVASLLKSHHQDPVHLALGFVLGNQNVASALVGTTDAGHLAANVESVKEPLAPGELSLLRSRLGA